MSLLIGAIHLSAYVVLIVASLWSIHAMRGAQKAAREAAETAQRTLAKLEAMDDDPNAGLRARAAEQMTLSEETMRESERLIAEAFDGRERP